MLPDHGAARLAAENKALAEQLQSVGQENQDLRRENNDLRAGDIHKNRALYDQLRSIAQENEDLRRENNELRAGEIEKNRALYDQLKSVAQENQDLRKENDKLRALHAEASHRAGTADTLIRFWKYEATRLDWRHRSLCEELFGPSNACSKPPETIPPEFLSQFTSGGKVQVEYAYRDCTYPDNYPLIYTDKEIDAYIATIEKNLQLPPDQRDWFIYGTVDEWVCDAIRNYPIRDQTVVNMGSLTPWYEAMLIYFGAKPTTIDYNRIITRSNRMRVMTIAEWEQDRTCFDAGFSISSFEHDGLGMYGDPIDPDGDLKAMRKMKERIKPGGLLFLAVPTGRDRILFNIARIYGKHRLRLLMSGWDWIDSFGYTDDTLDGNGDTQPLYVLRNSS